MPEVQTGAGGLHPSHEVSIVEVTKRPHVCATVEAGRGPLYEEHRDGRRGINCLCSVLEAFFVAVSFESLIAH